MKQTIIQTVSLLVASAMASNGAIVVQNFWKLGENDSPAPSNGGAGNTTTVDLQGIRNLTKDGSPTYTQTVAPGSSYALAFNGSSGYSGTSVQSGVTTNFGMEIWARPTAANQNAVLFYNGNDGANGWGILLQNGVPTLLYGNQLIFSGGSAPINQTTHIAITRGSTGSTLYVNGVAVNTSNANNPNAPSGSVLIGRGFSGNQRFTGILDEARIFTFNTGGFQTSDLLYAVPEPGSVTLCGLAALTLFKRRRR